MFSLSIPLSLKKNQSIKFVFFNQVLYNSRIAFGCQVQRSRVMMDSVKQKLISLSLKRGPGLTVSTVALQSQPLLSLPSFSHPQGVGLILVFIGWLLRAIMFVFQARKREGRRGRDRPPSRILKTFSKSSSYNFCLYLIGYNICKGGWEILHS